MKRMIIPMVVLATLAMLASGCALGGKSAVPVTRYWLPADCPAPTTSVTPKFETAKLGLLTIAAPYDAAPIVLRRAGDEYAKDFYNQWIGIPQVVFRPAVTAALRASGRFGTFLPASNLLAPTCQVDVLLSDLYLDGTSQPLHAVVTATVMVSTRVEGVQTLLGTGEATVLVAVPQDGPTALTLGGAFSKALAESVRTAAECVAL